MAFAFGRATPSLRQPPSRCLDNPVPGNIIFSLNGEHHLLLKVLHFRVDKRDQYKVDFILVRFFVLRQGLSWRAMGDSNPRPQAPEACALIR